MIPASPACPERQAPGSAEGGSHGAAMGAGGRARRCVVVGRAAAGAGTGARGAGRGSGGGGRLGAQPPARARDRDHPADRDIRRGVRPAAAVCRRCAGGGPELALADIRLVDIPLVGTRLVHIRLSAGLTVRPGVARNRPVRASVSTIRANADTLPVPMGFSPVRTKGGTVPVHAPQVLVRRQGVARYQGMATPPFGRRIWPVMKADASEARCSTVWATSGGSPTLPSGEMRAIVASARCCCSAS